MNIALLLAAGKSTRAGQDKLWADVHGRPLWTLSAEVFYKHPEIDRLFIVTPAGHETLHAFWDLLKEWGWDVGLMGEKVVVVDDGGETRMKSFQNGIHFITTYDLERNLCSDDIILDHNAANPKLTAEEISAVIAAAKQHGAAAVSAPATDTLLSAEDGFYKTAVPRENIRLMQTPQAVRGDILNSIHLTDSTDLSSALLASTPIKMVEARPFNKKITTAEDIETLRAQEAHFGVDTCLGEDSHAFSSEGMLMLGGLALPEWPAMQANSDGDVILHALGRALAQATGLSFSETADALCESGEQNSKQYLIPLLAALHKKKQRLVSVSISIEGSRPHIDPLVNELKNSIAQSLSTPENPLPASAVRLSAHTGDKLTAFAKGEGLRCLALVNIM